MPTQACLDNIKKENPPIYCDALKANHCQKIQEKINKYCKHNGLGGDTPVPQTVGDDEKECYCCCSCFAWGTPIAVAEKVFKLIEEFHEGDEVLTTGPDVGSWVTRKVTMATGLDKGFVIDFMFYCLFSLEEEENETRYLIVTADHLFLLPDGKLKPIQDLRPGDQVRTASGGVAKVIFAVPGQYSNGVAHIAVGDWEPGQPLDGHLINSNDLVTADLAVQTNYYGGLISLELLAGDPALEARSASIGSRSYFEKYASPELTEFIADKRKWPKFFTPVTQPLINVPPLARAYFTQAQAEDIAANTTQAEFGNGAVLASVRYLVKIYGAFAPEIKFIIDWSNELPNAYFFDVEKQRFAVITGGLARVTSFGRNGMAIVLAHLLANDRGSECVGPADYDGIFYHLREAWNNDLFFSVFKSGMAQLKVLFDAISPENRQENPDDICAQPSIDCRIETMNAAMAFDNEPSCGIPTPSFALDAVQAKTLWRVAVTFNREVDIPSAETAENYTILAGVSIVRAVVDIANHAIVRLTVKGLKRDKDYVLTVENVTDAAGQIISPEGNAMPFATKRVIE